MKNITLSADEDLIERARLIAREQRNSSARLDRRGRASSAIKSSRNSSTRPCGDLLQPMQPADAEQYLSAVLRPLVAGHSSQAQYAEALRLRAQIGLSWYNSLIVSASIHARCDLLYAEDLRHGQRFGSLQVGNPFL
jgi:hypothetical protein